MNLLLFFGSGISIPSGLPNVSEITNSVLYDEWFDGSDLNFHKGRHPSPYYHNQNLVPKLQEFLKFLKGNADVYLKERGRNESTYEDLFFLCKQIYENELCETDNPAIQPYVELIKTIKSELIIPIPTRPELKIDFQLLAERSCDFIHSVVWDSLFYPNQPVGLDLLLDIIKADRFKSVNIATLNHDLLIETILEENQIKYIDGFGPPRKDIRYFDTSEFQKKSKIKLLKLHGSINWFRFREQKDGKTLDRYGLALRKDFWHLKGEEGNFAFPLDGSPLFLTGTENKLLSYNFGIFRKIQSFFDLLLEPNNVILMSGYGWNDRGINGRLFEWLDSSLEKKLILLHKYPKHIRDYSKSAMWHRYDSLVEQGKLVLVKKWFSELNIKELEAILDNLN